MSDLNKIISATININSCFLIKALSTSKIEALSSLVLWDDSTPDDKPVLFGGHYFRPLSKGRGVIIDTGSKIFDYELKAVMVAALHLGVVEGGSPYKWKSVANKLYTLKKFCSFLITRDCVSFRELADTPELKLRNLLKKFLHAPKHQGGMEIDKYTSSAKASREALTFLHVYGLVDGNLLAPMIEELTASKIRKHTEEHRLKHPIIPTAVMKSVLESSANYISKAKANIGLFIDAHTKANCKIAGNGCSDTGDIIVSSCRKFDDELSVGYSLIRDLNLHVYTLVLAFTGMRDSEVFALKNNCHSRRFESEETVFTVKSELSKTTEGTLELDWIANEAVFDAVDLLSTVNDVYRERARLLLLHHKHKMSKGHILKYEKGLKENRLFGISHTKHTTNFVESAKASDASTGISMSRHSFQVSANDIEQLEKMGCNYQSVNQQSGKRGLKYKVGDSFNLTPHQFRHTFAWFIIANRLGDLDDIKYQFKHLSRVMTIVYAERGYESLSELRTVIEYFEELTNKLAIEEIVDSAKKEQIAGGGGDRLAKFLAKLNSNQSQVIYTTAQQPHFNNTQELIDFATRHSDSIRGLPHGYCTKGAGCKIKNAADPSHCLYCETYYATPKHLPYWKAIKLSCEQKINRINTFPDTSRYQSFLTGLEDNLYAANEIICKLMTTPLNNEQAAE